ncbi:MAG: hypothetical protein M3Y59_06565 [Myxococcota bacterium]|nr:hypothetical protein [Myxococcota bacterium]
MTRPWLLLSASLSLALVACGPALESREDAAAILAQGSIPTAHAQQTARRLLSVASAVDPLPQPSVRLTGTHGGEATIEFNLVGAVVGLVGEGLLFNIHYADYSNDGMVRLSGDVAVLANFQYVAQPESGEDPYADLKLTLAGRTRVSGLYSDELYARIALTTRFHDLQFREDSLQMRLDGYVEGDLARFEFDQEDVIAAWARFAEQR